MRRRHSLPAAAYALVDRTPGAVLLEGAAQQDSNQPPWTRLFTAPLRVCTAHRPEETPRLFAEIDRAVTEGLCAAGFFSYECGMAFEPKAGMRPAREDAPLAWFGIYERARVFDHERGRFVEDRGQGSGIRDQGAGSEAADSPAPEDHAALKGQDFSRAEWAATEDGAALALEGFPAAGFCLSESEYAERIAAIHEYIRAGDVYQLNFTAPFRIHAPSSAAALYARLRAQQPAAYGAFLHWQPGRRILSFSPELFFRIENDGQTRRIVTRPMKGTARRGRTTREDRAAAEWLRNDAKNRSENLMIVDLVRNDLGRIARFGTVRAEDLFAVERLPTLWQMTSTVTAELRGEIGYEGVFRALFPCGSITGAPKVRAMQLIGELEGGPRGVYTGAIGFFSPRQTMFNVAIRTLELVGEQGAMGVGSGIVIDSDPAAEYRECRLKAEFLARAARPDSEEFQLIETMLWEDGYPLLELHLDRLADSADYFDFCCDRAAVKAALETYADQFAGGTARRARRVRLLLDSSGGLQIAGEEITGSIRETLLAGRAANTIGRVRRAAGRTDPADPMLFHKTTLRPLYASAFADAQRAGCDDVLFLNHRGEVTEGAISNVFIVKDGRWFTPPIECGLLAGVYRRHLLVLRPEIEERVLGEDDLRAADAIYIANAVRGLRKVALED